jgi:predicted enzyme related to lactoylglutathione lyase
MKRYAREQNMNEHEKINYLEFPSKNLDVTKKFYSDVFGWSFLDYGPEYCAIQNGGLDGGFYKSELVSKTDSGSVLVVIFSNELEATERKISQFGGEIVKEIFQFPGGRRFHFVDPTGNELAVWSEK